MPDNPYAQWAPNPYAKWAPAPTPSADTSRETSAPGLAASAARGMAPEAAGALAGGAIGSLAGGVGAVPGAVAGVGAVEGARLVSGLYNSIGEVFGWPRMATPQEMTDRVMDAVGIWKPATPTERIAEATAGGAAGALSGARAAEIVAQTAGSAVTRGVASQLAQRPAAQVASGALSGASAQSASEMGAGPTERRVASLVGGSIPYGGGAVRGAISAEPRRVAMEAHQAGYVLPPIAFSEKPGIISTTLSGLGGKIKTQQAASERNQEVTNTLAGRSLGVPAGTPLSPQIFETVRNVAGQQYERLANAVPTVQADHAYDVIVSNLGSRNAQARQFFPTITKNQGIDDLVNELQSVRQFPGRAGLDIVKQLRFEANRNLRAQDPKAAQLGLAQRQAADAVDGLIERNLAATGQQQLVSDYRAARQVIAKSYDVEAATNFATGDVRAITLAALGAKGRPLSGDLDTIARVAAAFPKAVQRPSAFGHDEGLSALDVGFMAASAATGHLTGAGVPLLRAPTRAAMLSGSYQRTMATPRQPASIPLPLLTQPGLSATVPLGTP